MYYASNGCVKVHANLCVWERWVAVPHIKGRTTKMFQKL